MVLGEGGGRVMMQTLAQLGGEVGVRVRSGGAVRVQMVGCLEKW